MLSVVIFVSMDILVILKLRSWSNVDFVAIMNNDNTDEGGSKNLAEVDDGSKKADDDDDDDDADEGGGKDEKAQWKHGNAEDD